MLKLDIFIFGLYPNNTTRQKSNYSNTIFKLTHLTINYLMNILTQNDYNKTPNSKHISIEPEEMLDFYQKAKNPKKPSGFWSKERCVILQEIVANLKTTGPFAIIPYLNPWTHYTLRFFPCLTELFQERIQEDVTTALTQEEQEELALKTKVVRQKWMQNLCPNILAPSIQEHHKNTLHKLREDYDSKWSQISKNFCIIIKDTWYYYPENTIKNFFLNNQSKLPMLLPMTPSTENPENLDTLLLQVNDLSVVKDYLFSCKEAPSVKKAKIF